MIREDLLEKFLDELTIEDLPSEDLQMLAHACGIETVIKLLRYAPKITFNLPKNWYSIKMEKHILGNCDGTNQGIKKAAAETGYSMSKIRNVLAVDRTRKKVIKEQTKLFEQLGA